MIKRKNSFLLETFCPTWLGHAVSSLWYAQCKNPSGWDLSAFHSHKQNYLENGQIVEALWCFHLLNIMVLRNNIGHALLFKSQLQRISAGLSLSNVTTSKERFDKIHPRLNILLLQCMIILLCILKWIHLNPSNIFQNIRFSF